MPKLIERRCSLIAGDGLGAVEVRRTSFGASNVRRFSAPPEFLHHGLEHLKQPDDVLYFTDEYITYLKKTGQKKVVIVVSSWSESVIEHARSINLGSRQCRDLVHHILLALRLKKEGIKLIIKYFSFDNTKHFNYKSVKAVDNKITNDFIRYVCSFLSPQLGVILDDDQFQPVYFNPRFTTKEGDYVCAEFPDKISYRGHILFCSGPNAKILEGLRNEIFQYKMERCKVIGMTVHSGGDNIDLLAKYLGIELIGTTAANSILGTKPGNKRLFLDADVPIAEGTTNARTDINELINDCFIVARKTTAKKLIIKLTSSSAGKGNLDVDITACYTPEKAPDVVKISAAVERAIVDGNFKDKINKLGAIVEERLEGKNITSPGVLAVVTRIGEVKVLYIYDQILGSGNFFGGSIGPTIEDISIQETIYSLTIKVGKEIFKKGGHGYFGLDFLTRDTPEGKIVDVIEANIRKTGTLYPWISCLHLLGPRILAERTISQDDNVTLPFKIQDLTGRVDTLNFYMSCLYRFLVNSPVSFNHKTKTGAFVTFDTHSAGKIGVVFIGNGREHVDYLKKQFKQELDRFTYDEFVHQIYKHNASGIDLASLSKSSRYINNCSRHSHFVPNISVTTSDRSDSVRRDYLGVMIRKAELALHSTVSSVREVAIRSSTQNHPTVNLTNPIAIPPLSAINSQRAVSVVSLKPYGTEFIFGVFGRTDSNNALLKRAAQEKIVAYRFDSDSRFWFDRQTRRGQIQNVFIAIYDEKFGDYLVKHDTINTYELPTVVYDNDFTNSRRHVYQSLGDRTITDKVLCVTSFIEMIGAVPFNTYKDGTPMKYFLSSTRSQVAMHQMCLTDRELAALYPKTQSLTGNVSESSPELVFVNNHAQFYIKPALSERKLDSNLGNIFVRKHIDYSDVSQNCLYFTYIIKTNEHGFVTRDKKLYLKSLTLKDFYGVLDVIKNEMGYDEDEQFILQEYLASPDVRDVSGKSLSKKIRIITQHNPEINQVVATSVYAIYGGPNSYLGYVGDPKIYINEFLKSAYNLRYHCINSEERIYAELFSLAIKMHNLAEKELGVGGRLGESIVDFILTARGPVPIKISTKPERIDVARVSLQTHMKTFLEGTREHRIEFIQALEKNESARNLLVIEHARSLYQGIFISEEKQRRHLLSRVEPLQRTAHTYLAPFAAGPAVYGPTTAVGLTQSHCHPSR